MNSIPSVDALYDDDTSGSPNRPTSISRLESVEGEDPPPQTSPNSSTPHLESTGTVCARSEPRHCTLCGFKYRVSVHPETKSLNAICPNAAPVASPDRPIVPASGIATTCTGRSGEECATLRCTRCGLVTMYSLEPSERTKSTSAIASGDGSEDGFFQQPVDSANLLEAARAYKFILLSETSPLLKDLASIVVDYLLWYRGPDDFKPGDLVDAKDLRGRWLLGRVDSVENGKLLIHYVGYTSKWDQWMDSQSSNLAPCHTKSKTGQQTPQTEKLRSTMSWNNSCTANRSTGTNPTSRWKDSSASISSSASSSSSSSTNSVPSTNAAISNKFAHHTSAAASSGGSRGHAEDFADVEDSPLGPSSIPPAAVPSPNPNFTQLARPPANAPPPITTTHSTSSPTQAYSVLTRPSPSKLFVKTPSDEDANDHGR